MGVLGRRKTKLKKHDFKIELESGMAREVKAVIFLGLSILSYLVIAEKAGLLGDFVNKYLRLLFGVGALIVPIFFLLISATLFVSRRIRFDAVRNLGIILLGFSILGLIHMGTHVETMLDNVTDFGGYVGFLASVLERIFIGDLGTKVVLSVVLVVGLILTFEISIRKLMLLFFPEKNKRVDKEAVDFKLPRLNAGKEKVNIVKPQVGTGDLKMPEVKVKFQKVAINKPEPIKKTDEIKVDETDYSDWELPSLDLLSSEHSEVSIDDKVLQANAEKIREKLAQFEIDVTMKDVNIGPTVMQYTLRPAEHVKLNKITSLKNDLAMSLAAKSIRIEAPIPGKPLVGIEVPNEKRMVVHLREILASEEFASMNSKLRLAIGRDVSGTPVVDDLATMPHLLIAGATGSGKSVGMNTFLMSLLYQNSPQDLKFIMVDPKRVELTSYNSIPHLLAPVITDPDKAHSALKWAVQEMNRRYKEMAEKHFRNIEEYNAEEPKKMPKIVIVIDELADLMMQPNKKETEMLICRLAQMARAVGMHLILATQRPSVDVITGLIKANIPTRIAFTVTSGVDSRTIIDTIGAEDLLGMGDMLYLPGGMTHPVRVQGIYVSSKEIERVTNRIKLTKEPQYDEDVIDEGQPYTSPILDLDNVGRTDASDGMEQDDLYEQAIDVIRETKKASASLLQRRLSVGYARAARLLDILEEHGLIGPVNGAKPREIYIADKEEVPKD